MCLSYKVVETVSLMMESQRFSRRKRNTCLVPVM
uniref:Uncharacterized protein n=1 Tax=Anguilla anguilla TaxID=7936 RepID=A0A0E9Q2F2_ANGAN